MLNEAKSASNDDKVGGDKDACNIFEKYCCISCSFVTQTGILTSELVN